MIIAILILTILVLIIYTAYLRAEQQQVIAINTGRRQYNEELERDIEKNTATLQNLKATVGHEAEFVDKLKKIATELQEDAEIRAQKAYEAKVEETLLQYEEYKRNAEMDFQAYKKKYDVQIKDAKEQLNQLRSKQEAYVLAQQRQEEISTNRDYYRLVIDKVDSDDIKLLRELQVRFARKEAVDKLIWENYFKPAYDLLMSHLFDNAEKISGIYKITDLTTGAAYIGQSVDVRERLRQHIKASLAYGKATNKLYQAMQKSGQDNFTFEVLEKVPKDQLNEREVYWIDFYKTKEAGLNSTKGGA